MCQYSGAKHLSEREKQEQMPWGRKQQPGGKCGYSRVTQPSHLESKQVSDHSLAEHSTGDSPNLGRCGLRFYSGAKATCIHQKPYLQLWIAVPALVYVVRYSHNVGQQQPAAVPSSPCHEGNNGHSTVYCVSQLWWSLGYVYWMHFPLRICPTCSEFIRTGKHRESRSICLDAFSKFGASPLDS